MHDIVALLAVLKKQEGVNIGGINLDKILILQNYFFPIFLSLFQYNLKVKSFSWQY